MIVIQGAGLAALGITLCLLSLGIAAVVATERLTYALIGGLTAAARKSYW